MSELTREQLEKYRAAYWDGFDKAKNALCDTVQSLRAELEEARATNEVRMNGLRMLASFAMPHAEIEQVERPSHDIGEIVNLIRHIEATPRNSDAIEWMDKMKARAETAEQSLQSEREARERAEGIAGEFITDLESESGMSMSQVSWHVAALTILRVIKQRADQAERDRDAEKARGRENEADAGRFKQVGAMLDSGAAFSLALNANDTFGYACADTVEVETSAELAEVADIYGVALWKGTMAWMERKTGNRVIKEHRTAADEGHAAIDSLREGKG